MRTTVTLDDDVVAALQQLGRERGISFKEALNASVRMGLRQRRGLSRPYRVQPFRAEVRPGVDLRTANRLAADLEDQELAREIELGK